MNFNQRKLLLFFSATFILIKSFAQLFPEKNYPKSYFQWPVGSVPGIVANFGELRPNHYHMGLDCRTASKVNVPIYAAADGYISKVSIDPTGFGQAIYINHPNGMTTLYAHLNSFFSELQEYVQEQQYRLEKWKVTLDIPKDFFKVKKGDFIANSGSTGGSQGPHLHFEIRDTKTDKVLNPLLMGMPLEDNIPPDILRLAVYDRRYSTYEQSPKILQLKKIGGVYQPISGDIKVNTDKVSFAISSFDRYTGSTNQNGIFKAELYDNEKAITGFEMDSISYDETRYINAHIDFKTKNNGGAFLQHLSPLPGYQDGIYKTGLGEDGITRLTPRNAHQIKIIVSDANGNNSVLQFNLIMENWSEWNTKIGKVFKPGNVNVFEQNNFSFYLPENAIYDSFHFKFNEVQNLDGTLGYQIQDDEIPVHCYFPIKIKADFSWADSNKVEMKLNAHNKIKFKKAFYKNGQYESTFRDFGLFELVLDKTPPVVTPLWGFKDGLNTSKINKIAFTAIDNSDEIVDFTALLDGKWLLFSNDKGKTFIYHFDKYCTPGEHSLKLIVRDIVGNTTEKIYRFKR